jgi:putative phosphoserine phosphatase/1-acylglycerol-3-phosphate O-acyltransferase
LAALTGATVVPVGLWGTEKVWPRSARVPNVLNVLDPPLVTVRVGAPVKLKHDDPDVDTKKLMKAIMELLPPESRAKRKPTPEEVAAAMPPGSAAAKATPESKRRPGTD